MTTIQQLPIAPTLSGRDQVLISQNGTTTTTTVAQLLATTQPLITIATNTLIGRASMLPGGPEALGVGHGLILQSGTLSADTSALATAANAALSGAPTAPTAPPGSNSNAIATTAFVAVATAAVVAPMAGVGLRRAGNTLSVNLIGVDGSAAIVQTASGVTRSLAMIATDQPNPRNLGAHGDGITDDTAAIQALNTAGGGTVPPGTYNTTLDASTFTNGRIQGNGRVRDGSLYLRAPSIAAIASKPTGSADESWIGPAFNGDFSRTHLAFEHRVTDSAGGHTVGLPGLNSYLYNPQTAAIYGYVYNSSGYNGATGDNNSRTGMVASRIKIDQYGQGDMVAYNASGFVASALPGATHFLANPAVTLFNGDLQAGVDGAYLNPIEVIINDQGHDVAGAGSVVNLNRTNNTGALGASWFGYRTQSVGTKAIDAHFSTSGAVRVSMDLVGATSPIKGAIAMKANDRLYFNATNPDSHLLPNTLVPGTEWLEYDPLSGAQFVVAGTPVAQFKPSGGRLSASPATADSSTAIATTAFVKTQGFISSPNSHLFGAVDYGAKFDGSSDDAPGIQAAINAARDAGGGRVLLPGRKGILRRGLVIDHPAISIAGTGATTVDDYTAQTYLAGRAGTRLVWGGPLGGTMLTLQLNTALNGAFAQLKGCHIEGILWDCNGGADAHGSPTSGAATAVATWFGWDSHHDIWFMNPTQIGVRYETCQGITGRIYGACYAVNTASALLLAASTRTGTSDYGTTSLNSFPVVRVGIANGDGVVFRETDHNYLATVDVIRAGGGTGRGIVFSGARDQPPGGPVNALCAYMNRIGYCSTGGGAIVAEGLDTPGVIAPSFCNIIEWLDISNATPLPTKGVGASIFYADDSGYTYNPLVVSPVFANQSGQLTSGGIQAQLAGETVAIWHSGTAHLRLYASDYATIWHVGVNATTGNLEMSPDRKLHGAVQVSLGNGAGLHVDSAVVAYGSGQFNNLTLVSPSDPHSIGMTTNVGPGYLNPLAQAGDNIISFSAGSVDSGGLVIGPWASHGYGLRLAADGTASVNGSAIWTASSLSNVGQLANNSGYLTASTQPIATIAGRGTVKIGAGLTVGVDGTLATVPVPLASTGATGQVKVGSGLVIAADGTLSTAAVPVATASATGQVKIGSGLTVGVDGMLATAPLPTATNATPGLVKIGAGLLVAGDGTLATAPQPVASSSAPGQVKIGSGLTVTVDGTLATASLPTATGATPGLVKIGAGLSVAGDGTLATTPQPVASSSATGQVKIGSGLTVAVDGTLATASLPAATNATPGLVKIGAGLSVAGDGTLATTPQPAASSSAAGQVKIGSGLAVAADGTLSTMPGPVATASSTGQVKIGPGLTVAVDGTLATATLPVATAATPGLVKIGAGLSVAGDGTLATAVPPVATTAVPGPVKIGSGLTVALDGTLAAVTQPIASAAVAGAVKVGGGLLIAADGTLTAVVATLSALRALPWAALVDGATLSVAAFSLRGDGGGGVFTWNASATAADDGGTVINPTGNAGAGRWTRQIMLGRVTPQMFGAKADGVTNDTAAFNAALKLGRVTVPFASYVVSGVALTNGCDMEGGAGLGYSGDTAATAVVRPILIAGSGAVSILNATGVKDFSLSGLFLDGNNTGCDGISAGSTQMTLNRVTVTRCNNGLGSAAGTDLYTHIATLIDCQFANCTNGITNLIDSAMLAGAVSACQYGLWLSSGAAANNFIGVRYEWCTQHNIHIFQAQKNQFIGGLVDRGYVAGAYLAGAADIHFVGVQFSRNGRNNDATWLGNSHLVLDSNNAAIAVTNPIWTSGKDDDGTGALTPQYGITYNNTNDRITVTSGDGSGYVTGFARGTEPTNYVLRDVSGAGDSIVTAARPYMRGGTAAHTVQTRNSANVTAGLSSTIAMGQSAITGGYTAYSRELKLYAIDFSTGNSYGARFNLTFYYDTTAHPPNASAAFGEIGGAGTFQFSATAGTLRLSITGLSADGSAFTLNVKNGSASGNFGVWAELH